MRARGTDGLGLIELVGPDGVIATDFLTDGGPCSNVVLTPGRIRRELLSSEGTVLEDLFAFTRLPGALMQWQSGTERDLALTLRWSVPRSHEPIAEGEDRLLWAPHEGEAWIAFRIDPTPVQWTRTLEADAWRLSARVRSVAGTPISWIAGGGRTTDLAAGPILAARALEAQERVQAGWLRELSAEYMSVRTGVHELDAGVEWAKVRLAGLDAGQEGRAELVCGRLGCGLFTDARAALVSMAERDDPALGRTLGRYVLWTGDASVVEELREPLERWLDRGDVDDGGRSELSNGLEGLGFDELAQRVRAAVHSAPRRLPVVGGGAPGPRATPDTRWAEIRERLGEAVRNGGAWRADEGFERPAWSIPDNLVFRVLGASAEAALGRLVLRPALPPHLNGLEIRRIRVGDETLDFAYERHGATHSFELSPSSGNLPLNVVLEPLLPGSRLARAAVDGGEVELDWTARGKRTAPRLQLPVDRKRSVELVVEE